MRITLNETSQRRLLAIMSKRGISNPTHMLNLLLSEAAGSHLIPSEEDRNESSTELHRAA